MMKKIVLILALTISATACTAATWHVAKDGSGDFMVIQEAIDAAAPGDVIRIHAGRYEELTENWDPWENGTLGIKCHVIVTKDNLTLEGDGADVTIIGPEQYPDDPGPSYTGIGVTYNEAFTLTLRDLAVEHVQYGLYAASDHCNVYSCRFEGMYVDGVHVRHNQSCTIDDCDFVGLGCVSALPPTGNVTVTNSRFNMTPNSIVRGFLSLGAEYVHIADCVFSGGGEAVNLQQGTVALIESVTVAEIRNGGITLSSGAFAEVYDTSIEGGNQGIGTNGASAYCERVSLSGQLLASIYVNSSGVTEFHDCDIINGGGWSVYCSYPGTADCHLDMTNCYWGTDSEDQIAEWILDSYDDPDRDCTVDFIPFQGIVAAEEHSWSSVKGLFADPVHE